MDEIKFLCGCSIPLRAKESVVDEDTIVHAKVIAGRVRKDAAGMLVCAEHGVRRYGWRSLPHATITNEKGEVVQTNRTDFRLAGMSFVEIEEDFLRRNSIAV